jgi:hypothetical protein
MAIAVSPALPPQQRPAFSFTKEFQMQDFVPERDERASLQLLLAALDASERALRRDPPIRGQDDTGDWSIRGRLGHIYPDGTGYLLCVVSDERDQSARRWTNVKARLAGLCQLTQDGDDEGALRIDRLPAPHEAGVIREALGIKRKRQLSAEAKVSLAQRLSEKPTGSPSDGPGSARSLCGLR